MTTTRLLGIEVKEELRPFLREFLNDTRSLVRLFPMILPASRRDIEVFSRRLRAANGRGEMTARVHTNAPEKIKEI